MALIDRDKLIKDMGQFDLIMLAAKRGRDIQQGAPVLTDREGSSAAVTALREIEEGHITNDYKLHPEFDPDAYFDLDDQ